MEKIEMIVKLTLVKLEIYKLKHGNQGYDWHCCGKEGRELIDKTLTEIEQLLKQLEKQ